MITNIIWINIHIELYSLQRICVLICVYALYICISMVIYHTHTHIYIYMYRHTYTQFFIICYYPDYTDEETGSET